MNVYIFFQIGIELKKLLGLLSAKY